MLFVGGLQMQSDECVHGHFNCCRGELVFLRTDLNFLHRRSGWSRTADFLDCQCLVVRLHRWGEQQESEHNGERVLHEASLKIITRVRLKLAARIPFCSTRIVRRIWASFSMFTVPVAGSQQRSM